MTVTVLGAALVLVASVSAQTCTDKGTLSSRFVMNININDADSDGHVTGDEVFKDFTDNYDKDMDGCVSQQEWMDRWTSYFKFSPEFAKARLDALVATDPTSTPACLIKYASYKGNPHINFPVPGFVEANAQVLVDVCLNTSVISSIDANCDCAGLQGACVSDANLNSTGACSDYLIVRQFGPACRGKGYISDRFQKNVDVNDPDNDGFVTGPEIFMDFQQNYDVNNDSCCSQQEWINRWESYFKFSKEYALKRLADISVDITVPCVINYAAYKTDSSTRIPRNVFLQDNLQSLVDVCSSDKDLYRTDCDCVQLKDGCIHDPALSATVACTAYVKSS